MRYFFFLPRPPSQKKISNESVEQQLSIFNAIAEFQDELLSLDFSDESALSLFKQKLFSSPLLNSKRTFRSVLVSIYTIYLSRQHSDLYYINFFIEVAKLPQNSFTSDDYIFNFTNKFFIYQLYKAGIVTKESIFDESNHSYDFFHYFYPEIKEHYPNSPILEEIRLSSILQSVNSAGYQFKENDIQSCLEKFVELRSAGKNPNPIALSIRNDDIERLQQLLSQSNTSANSIVEHSIFERFVFINSQANKVSLIEYAAFFGSIKCFKFLYHQSSDVHNLTKYAVAGGNYEIIHLCEQCQCEFNDESLMISIRFFRPELTEYLEENFDLKKTVDDVSKSIVYYNLHALIDCEEVICENPNELDSGGYAPLILASLNGDIDVINYFITKFGAKIDVNLKNAFKNSSLYYAAEKGHIDVVKYLSKLPEIDINLQNNRNRTALHVAAENGRLNIVKYLCSLPNIDINPLSERIIRPIDLAIENNHLEVAEFLANLPGISIYDIDNSDNAILESAALSNRIETVKFAWKLVCKSLDDAGVKDVKEFIKKDIKFRYHMVVSRSFTNDDEIIKFLSNAVSMDL